MSVKIVFVLDESGSMATLRNDLIGGFNTTIKDQQSVAGEADVTLITFSSSVKTVFENKPLADVELLTEDSYKPSGGTAMNDAIGIALDRVISDNPEKAIINIFTDGYENASREYTPDKVKGLVKQAENRGYQVVFLAANIDQVAVGTSYGFALDSIQGFVGNAKGTTEAYASASNATRSYRSA